jgi:hypothetical protein
MKRLLVFVFWGKNSGFFENKLTVAYPCGIFIARAWCIGIVDLLEKKK